MKKSSLGLLSSCYFCLLQVCYLAQRCKSEDPCDVSTVLGDKGVKLYKRVSFVGRN